MDAGIFDWKRQFRRFRRTLESSLPLSNRADGYKIKFIKPKKLIFPEETAEKLLELADRFLIPSAKYSLELFMKMCKMDKMNKIRIADKYKFMDSPIDLSAFVLYNLRLGESAETSYKKYEKLCEAMGKSVLSFNDYKYWFQMYYKQKER